MGGEAGEHFRLWLRAGLTGCDFAKRLASKAQALATEVHVEATHPPTSWLNNAFDEHARHDRPVVAIFPQISSEGELVQFLRVIGIDPRWKVRREAKASPGGAVLIGLDWTTSEGDRSSTMGFAPFASMPVPRRAPYVAIATWPGGRRNPFRGMPPTPREKNGQVGFLDAAHGMAAEEYGKRWASTTEAVASLMSIPKDDAKLYREAAFILPPENADQLFLP